jgi:hypothetical protein
MGCGQTLLLTDEDSAQSDGLAVTVCCGNPECPRPHAVAEIIADAETEHLVTFTESDWTIKHPLRERLNDALLKCELPSFVGQFFALNYVDAGRYRVRSKPGGGWLPAEKLED